MPTQKRYDERRNRRLVTVVRGVLVCAVLGALSASPTFLLTGAEYQMGVLSITILMVLATVYLMVLWLAGKEHWSAARNLLFAAWAVYPSSVVVLYRADLDPAMATLFIAVGSLFVALVEMGMMALAPWRTASRWIGAMLLLYAGTGIGIAFTQTPDPQVFLILFGICLLLQTGVMVPALAMVRDLQSMVIDAERNRVHALELGAHADHALAQAEAANTAKSRFLANMSHELRTPLNAILGYVELVAELAEEEGIQSFDGDLDRIHHAGSHLLGLINAVLDLSKIEAGKMEVVLSSVDLHPMLGQLVATIQPLATDKNLQVNLAFDRSIQPFRSDAQKLRQVLLNLLSNAVKFTDTGSIHLKAEQRGDMVAISIIDSGVGIDADRLEDIFIAFERTDAEITRRVGGTGLGLAISHRLCELMGGTLDVSSVLEEGSTFTVTLPTDLTDYRQATTGGGLSRARLPPTTQDS